MTSLQRIALVARREMRERIRSRAFLFSSAFTLLLLLGFVLVPSLVGDSGVDVKFGTLGDDNDAIVAAVEALAIEENPDAEVNVSTVGYADRPAAEEGIRSGEVQVVLVDGDTLLVESSGGGFFGPDQTQGLVQRAAASIRIQELIGEQGQAAADVIGILTSDALEVEALDGGETDEDDAQTRGLIAYVGLLLMYIAILSYGAWTLTGVTEEKTNRVVEILLSTVRPWQLLAGKVLGIGTLGLAQFSLTLLIAWVAVQFTGVIELPDAPLGFVLGLVGWYVLGFAVYSVVFAAAGSLVSRMEEAQNVSLPITLLAVAGFFVSFQALEDPDGMVAVVTTFIPFTAPFVVPIRVALGAIPAWQHVAALAVTMAGIYLLVRLAGRVYAGGILQSGARIKVRDAYRSAEL